ncbi:hypothetical protein [Mesobacillus selenatarsenatis]|uniref:Uncharacterized protein n=1 Tax=Mesobacillus selenatarsenatis (strain DSM 18680 / JCM 14380 / FERM P-15431 / SF-1) TaxID=1321606 RepID=A0A0A8X2H8_MESS1|nr:hypothetical protein [Mesobacillus selenatarsenatis]GAM12326.1 hypothetical protein SAMD00020551_0458 [Mesobacillus selenatarsenatis SF-1]
MFLYHIIIEDIDDAGIPPQRVLKEGLNRSTATRWYSRGANFFPELTERFRPDKSPKWIDFKVAFGADLEPYEKPYFRFPLFSEKILVFNFDISSDLFAFIEDEYDGGRGKFVEGIPSKEELMKEYWKSMIPLSAYLKLKPFNNPEVYIFEQVPAELIDFVE